MLSCCCYCSPDELVLRSDFDFHPFRMIISLEYQSLLTVHFWSELNLAGHPRGAINKEGGYLEEGWVAGYPTTLIFPPHTLLYSPAASRVDLVLRWSAGLVARILSYRYAHCRRDTLALCCRHRRGEALVSRRQSLLPLGCHLTSDNIIM